MSASTEIIAETGGYRVGRTAWLPLNATWPFGALEVHRNRLVLRTLFRQYTFPRDSIVALSIFPGFFSPDLRIEHSIPSYPRFVVFGHADLTA
jgi:hypothetical protein